MKFFIFLAFVAVASAIPYGGHYEEQKDHYGKFDKFLGLSVGSLLVAVLATVHHLLLAMVVFLNGLFLLYLLTTLLVTHEFAFTLLAVVTVDVLLVAGALLTSVEDLLLVIVMLVVIKVVVVLVMFTIMILLFMAVLVVFLFDVAIVVLFVEVVFVVFVLIAIMVLLVEVVLVELAVIVLLLLIVNTIRHGRGDGDKSQEDEELHCCLSVLWLFMPFQWVSCAFKLAKCLGNRFQFTSHLTEDRAVQSSVCWVRVMWMANCGCLGVVRKMMLIPFTILVGFQLGYYAFIMQNWAQTLFLLGNTCLSK